MYSTPNLSPALTSLLGRINQYVLNPIILLMFVLALLYFFYGLYEFIKNAGNAEELETGKRNIMYGILGMVIMVGVYGIIHLILGTFGLNSPSYIRL